MSGKGQNFHKILVKWVCFGARMFENMTLELAYMLYFLTAKEAGQGQITETVKKMKARCAPLQQRISEQEAGGRSISSGVVS